MDEPSLDHSTLTNTRKRLAPEVFEEVFRFVLAIAAVKGLLAGKAVGVDSTTLEANAAMPWVAALPRAEGFAVNHERVERLWRREGLKVPRRQPKRGRLWLGDGSCVRPRPGREDHVRSYDFVQARTRDGRASRMLNVIDEYTRECLAIDVARRLTSDDVLERLSGLFVRRGVPEHIRSDNGPEFTAEAVREWLGRVGVATPYIEPGSPWEDGYIESFNGKLRDERLDGEAFDTLLEAKVLIERWRVRYNTVRPHSSLAYRPPAPEAIAPWTPALGAALLGPASMAGPAGPLT